jgi:hypothetical protein
MMDLITILNEYGKVVNIFIQYFWNNPEKASKVLLLKDIVDIPETWLSARLRKVAAREAIEMLQKASKYYMEHEKPIEENFGTKEYAQMYMERMYEFIRSLNV